MADTKISIIHQCPICGKDSPQTMYCSLKCAIEEATALAARVAELEGKRDHPEHYCHQCGGRNISWSTSNDLWNRVTQSTGEGILCPICFAMKAESMGVHPTNWYVCPEDLAARIAELEKAVTDFAHMRQLLHDSNIALAAENARLRAEVKEYADKDIRMKRIFDGLNTVKP